MNVADDPVVATLNEVVRGESAAAITGKTLQRVLRQLDVSAKLMAWEIVPLSAFAGALPENIRSCWIFVIRAGTATGAERHRHPHPLESPDRASTEERWVHSAINLAPALGGIFRHPAVESPEH